jgi:hypothetical protein
MFRLRESPPASTPPQYRSAQESRDGVAFPHARRDDTLGAGPRVHPDC